MLLICGSTKLLGLLDKIFLLFKKISYYEFFELKDFILSLPTEFEFDPPPIFF
jgi:hypothetical protein